MIFHIFCVHCAQLEMILQAILTLNEKRPVLLNAFANRIYQYKFIAIRRIQDKLFIALFQMCVKWIEYWNVKRWSLCYTRPKKSIWMIQTPFKIYRSRLNINRKSNQRYAYAGDFIVLPARHGCASGNTRTSLSQTDFVSSPNSQHRSQSHIRVIL